MKATQTQCLIGERQLTITEICGLRCLSAAADPASKPQWPPAGKITASSFGTCSYISSPTVPRPDRYTALSSLGGGRAQISRGHSCQCRNNYSIYYFQDMVQQKKINVRVNQQHMRGGGDGAIRWTLACCCQLGENLCPTGRKSAL